ncbi:right-handed parallel beta-helix repeat-containing protein [Halomarina litorea]|uniref:right-handed parallel beta-helix repeat-containing protein n=1 Tax=Halomarina litorea TaxID=2961595 RepID=UPI0020C3B930|nr:right-handed parallel beta-helix repeat-containing protein [Halomarina sp. BCD28]
MAHDSVDDPEERGAGTPNADSGEDYLLGRRNYLRLGVAAAGTMALASNGASAATTRHGIQFDRIVDAVDDLGWDPSGEREIEIPTDDGLLIEVPPGEYVFPGTGSKAAPVEGTLTRWGIRGTGEHWSDVTFRTSNGQSTRFVSSGYRSNGILLENVTFDNGPSRTGGDIGLTLNARDNVEVHDVEVVGMSGAEPYCRWTIKPKVTSPDGEANIVNFRKTGPSVFTGHGNSDGGGGCFPGNDGTVNFVDCRIENQGGDGGLYTGKHEGTCNFYNCHFANNDMAVLRMGAGSEIRDSTIVMDWDNAHPDNVVLEGDWDDLAPTGTSGIYCSSAEFGKSGGGFYNCDIVVKSTYRRGQAALSINNSEGNMTVKDCRIRVDVDGMPGIWGRNPADQRLSRHKTPSKPWGLTIENCSITGSSDDPAILLDHRHGSTIRDCCIQMEGTGPGIVLEDARDCRVENTNVNTNGQATVFRNCTARTTGITSSDSCPRPAWDGDSGSDGSDGGDSGESTTEPVERVLTIAGDGTLSEYTFTVDGSVRDNPEKGPLAGPDQISGSTASGAVASGDDSFLVEGQVTEFSLDGSAGVLLDGEAVAPGDLPALTAPPEPATEHVLEFVGTGVRAAYEVTVSGTLEHNREHGTVDTQDSISGDTATGVVLEGTDAYTFTGEISSLSLDADATVRIDGELVDPVTLSPASTLAIVSDSATAAAYRFTVSGDLAVDPERGALEDADNISGPSAEGAVSNDVDSYRFTGDVTHFDLRGEAAVYLDGEQVSADRLGTEEDPALPNLVVVDGTGSSGRCDYRFTVTGEVEKSFELGSLETTDIIEGGTVTGSVEGDVDGYRFTGHITSFDMDGTAAILFEESTD